MNTLLSYFPVSVLIGMLLLGLTGCGARATQISAKAPQEDATPTVTQSNLPVEAAPASLETFAALLDRA